MSLITFLNTLNPFTKKRDLVEKIRLINESLDTTITMYDMAIKSEMALAKGRVPSIATAVAKAISSTGLGKFRVSDDQLDLFILGHLRACKGHIETVREIFDSSSSGDVSKEGITYHRLTALNMVATISFVATYAHRLLTVQTMSRSNYEDKWVMENIQSFARGILITAVRERQFLDALSSVPDRTVTEESFETDIAVDGESKVDPLQFGLLGLSFNPFYFVGVKWAQHNISKMQANQADLKALKFQVAMLKDRRSGVEDPALERQIKVYEADAVALAESIQKTERKYGIQS